MTSHSDKPVIRNRHISYVCPQCHWSLEERKWQGLTDEEVRESIDPFDEPFSQKSFFYFAEVIEAKLKEKNT